MDAQAFEWSSLLLLLVGWLYLAIPAYWMWCRLKALDLKEIVAQAREQQQQQQQQQGEGAAATMQQPMQQPMYMYPPVQHQPGTVMMPSGQTQPTMAPVMVSARDVSLVPP
eukprot:COSAG05_NODE_1949_length_3794_cov_5.044182_3_plen_111_part_00